LKSPAIQDYEAAMKRVYPDGYSATAPKREGGANTETYASDADDANYLEEMAAGASESDKGVRRATTSVVNRSSAPAASKQHKRKKDDRGVYQAEAANPSASMATNVEGNLDIGRSSDSLDPRKNRRAVTNIFDQDPDFGEFGAVLGSQPLKGDPETVIKRTTEALRQDKDNPEYHYLRARAYQKMQRANDAYKDYTQAIEINPQVTKYFIGRASLFYQLNKPLMVDADVKRAQAIDQELPHKIQFGGEPYPPSVKWMGDGPDGN
jgi:tetratricopeptide (TPR) repeat protein